LLVISTDKLSISFQAGMSLGLSGIVMCIWIVTVCCLVYC